VTVGRRPRGGWWPDAVLVAGFAGLTLALWGGALLGADVAVRDWCDGHRPVLLFWAARGGNLLGQGGFLAGLAAALAVLLSWRRRSVRPLLPVVAAFVLTFGALQPLKSLTARPAPHALLAHPERFGPGGQSYPSGHLVNALVWYGILALLLSPWLTPVLWRVVRVVPPVVLTVTTVYLGYHWLTDTVAGVLLGIFLDRLLRRVDWDDLPLGRRLRASGWDRPAVDAVR
jgi:membrane-associated phospholipid phosphatase